jgi:hypothetical protein
VRKIRIEFSGGKKTLDDWCAVFTFQCVFYLVLTVAAGGWILMSPPKSGDQTYMIGLGLLTLATFAMRVALGAQRDREREAKEKEGQ